MSNVGFLVQKSDFEGVCTKRINISHRGYRSIPDSTNYRKIDDFKCQCGCIATLIHLNDAKKFDECPRCGSKNIVEFDRHYKSKMFNASFKLVERNGKDFIMTSKKHKVLFKSDDSIDVKDIGTDCIEFKDGKMKVTDYRGVEFNSCIGNNKEILNWFKKREIKAGTLMDVLAKDDEEYKYLNFLYGELRESIPNGRGYNRSEYSLPYALEMDYRWAFIERLYKADIKHGMIKYVYDNKSSFDVEAKKLHQIFKVPKVAMRVVRMLKSLYSFERRNITDFIEALDGNILNKVMDVIDSETLPNKYNILDLLDFIRKLHLEGYKNVEHLTNYICRRVKLEQGLDAPVEVARYLYDYVRIMKNELGFKHEKYPTSLKKVHDIAVMNNEVLNQNKTTSAGAKFDEIIIKEDYTGLEMEDELLSVIAPKSSQDLIKEGESLSHCVASYVKDVANGLCKVLFLRFTKEPELSYMTIEVRNNEIKQFKGFSNRKATDIDLDFIKKWAEKKQLRILNEGSL